MSADTMSIMTSGVFTSSQSSLKFGFNLYITSTHNRKCAVLYISKPSIVLLQHGHGHSVPLVFPLMHQLPCLPAAVFQAGGHHYCTCRYPNNFVLRLLTPQDTCRPLDIYPIKLTQDAIYVDVGAAASSRAYQTTRGGADSSIERNNVYALQPKSYIQGQDPSGNHLSKQGCHCMTYLCCSSSIGKCISSTVFGTVRFY